MAWTIPEIDERLLDRLDRAAAALGTSRAELVERALHHYLDHAEETGRLTEDRSPGPRDSVDWAAARRTMIRSRCALASCPHAGDCPVELCPL